MSIPLERALKVIDDDLAAGRSVGAQLYVWHDGATVCDDAVGDARPDSRMTADTLMAWMSCSKAVCAVAFAQQWERRRLDVDDAVAKHVPEFAAHGKGSVRIRHLLTHTAGIRTADWQLRGERFANDFTGNVAAICATEPEPDWPPGARAGYHVTSVMMMIAELVRRADGRDFDRYVRDEIFVPLGAVDSWIGIPAERFRHYGSRIGLMYDTTQEPPTPTALRETEADVGRVIPGGAGRGPIRELGHLYEMLIGRGQRDGVRLLEPTAVEALTARHRFGLLDETFGQPLDWGLGFQLDSKRSAGADHLYGYGVHASPRAFGHSGYRSSTAFGDPEYGLVVAVVFNGIVADDFVHSSRQNALCAAIYEDLGLAR